MWHHMEKQQKKSAENESNRLTTQNVFLSQTKQSYFSCQTAMHLEYIGVYLKSKCAGINWVRSLHEFISQNTNLGF